MDVKQIYDIVNSSIGEAIGKTDLVKSDLSNLVDVGNEVFTANAVDNYVKKLVDRIGKLVFVTRPYSGFAPKILMDSWEYGSVVEKINVDVADAEESPTWRLEDGSVYEQDKFTAPNVSVKFFNSKTTFEIPLSITDVQIRESFASGYEMNRFLESIYTKMQNKMTLAFEQKVMLTIDNAIAETIYADYGTADLGSKTTIRSVNLLKLYNDTMGTSLKKAKALYDKDFLRFAGTIIKKYIGRLSAESTLFNVGGQKRFTPKELLHVVLWSDYASASASYLESDTYHKELVSLPKYDEVPYWQGTGTDYAKAGQISVKTAKGHDVSVAGDILAVLFDREALGVCNDNRRTPTHRNDHAEFINLWYKADCSYFNDLNENLVVFFIQDAVSK